MKILHGLLMTIYQNGVLPKLQYYNVAHIMYMTMPIVLAVSLCLVMRKIQKHRQRKALMVISLVNMAIYVSYKIVMAVTYDTFDIWGELPLQLCNINIFLIPIALKSNNKTLFSYLYYIGVIGAICAFPFFDVYFEGRVAYSYPVVAFFVFHSLLVSIPIVIVSAGMYTPRIGHVFNAILLLLGLSLVMHFVNVMFIYTNLCVEANYFYTMGMSGNPLMDLLWRWIPIPYLFFLPILIPLIPINVVMALPFCLRLRRVRQCDATV